MQQSGVNATFNGPASHTSATPDGQSLTLRLPAQLARELESATHDFLVELLARGLREFRVERALEHYAHGGMSFGMAAQQAGVSQTQLARYAYARGLEPPATEETLAEELGEETQRQGQTKE